MRKENECLTENKTIGLSQNSRTTKIHIIVDGLVNPIEFLLNGSQAHDSQVVCRLINFLDISQSNIIVEKPMELRRFDKLLKLRK